LRIGFNQAAELKRLRGLNPDQALSVDRIAQHFASPGKRIRQRQGRDRALGLLDRTQQPVDHVMRAERPGRVMNQHNVGIHRIEPGANAVGALDATEDQLADVAIAEGVPCHVLLAFADHDANRVDCRM
jgi:hypothetical protein